MTYLVHTHKNNPESTDVALGPTPGRPLRSRLGRHRHGLEQVGRIDRGTGGSPGPIPICAASERKVRSRRSCPSMVIRPSVGSTDAAAGRLMVVLPAHSAQPRRRSGPAGRNETCRRPSVGRFVWVVGGQHPTRAGRPAQTPRLTRRPSGYRSPRQPAPLSGVERCRRSRYSRRARGWG